MQTKMMKLSTVKLKILDISLEQWLLFLLNSSSLLVFSFVLSCAVLFWE